VEQNVKINEKKKIKKLSREEKNQAILSEKGNLYCPTSLTTSKWSYTDQNRSKQKSKTEEGLSDSSTEMVKLDEESNFESKRVNSNIPSSSSLPSSDKEIKI
jgi:hypothetical protein